MSASSPILDWSASARPLPAGLPLVVALTGFTDAGNAVTSLVDYFRDELPNEPIVRFRNDALLDYRSRRPEISFDGQHLTDYEPPRLELNLVRDGNGTPFLVLSGYEPDFQWDAFSDAVVDIATSASVANVTWLNSIPMPVPHTRPLGTTVSGNRTDLTEAHSVWRPHTRLPATVAHLLEYRLLDRADVAGFVLLVPHYLGDTTFPAAALAGLDSVALATGLTFPRGSLVQDNEDFLTKVGEQVRENDELSRMLTALENQYDEYMAGATDATPIIHTAGLPSADELADELERFLATQPPGEDRNGPPKPGG